MTMMFKGRNIPVIPEAALAAIRYLLKSLAHSIILFQIDSLFRSYRLSGRYDRLFEGCNTMSKHQLSTRSVIANYWPTKSFR